jgi:hypothetical protein
MIGIHVYASTNTQYLDKHTAYSETIRSHHFTISYHEGYSKQVYLSDSNYLVLVDGWIFNSPSYGSQVDFIFELYLAEGNDFIHRVSGQFNILIVEKKRGHFCFFNDIFAFRKHYFTKRTKKGGGETLSISSDLEFLMRQTESNKPNYNHIRKNLDTPRYLEIGKSFTQEINPIKPRSILQTNQEASSYSIKKVASNFHNITTQEPVKFLQYIVNRIADVHKRESVMLLLSGGLDSRFLLELLLDAELNVSSASYGNTMSDEIQIAQKVAAANRISHFTHHLVAYDFIKNASQYIRQTAGLDIFVQSPVYDFYDSLLIKTGSQKLVLESGFALDAFLGGTQIDLLGGHDFAVENRIFSALAIRQSAHREYLEDRYAMYDYGIYFLMRQLPKKLIANHSFYYELCKYQVKNAFDIPLQSTMFDLRLDVQFWGKAKQIQQHREILALEQEKKLLCPSPHNRYYSDFDGWLRHDPDWLSTTNNFLLLGQSLVSRLIPDSSEIVKTVENHRRASCSESRRIIKWISLEMFLRELEYE